MHRPCSHDAWDSLAMAVSKTLYVYYNIMCVYCRVVDCRVPTCMYKYMILMLYQEIDNIGTMG